MKVIAFGQQSRVGKDTAATNLVSMMRLSNKYPRGVVKASFAFSLKHGAWLIWKQYGLREAEFYESREGADLRNVPLKAIGKTPVELWIEFGQAVRGIYAPTWRDVVLSVKDVDALVISDLRFANEVEGIKALGGTCVKIERPGAVVRHASDNEQLNYDEVIVNDGTLGQLYDKVKAFAEKLELV